MPKYVVISPVKDQDGIHQVDEIIEMDEKTAQELIDLGALAKHAASAPSAPADDQERLAAITAAIGQLDKDNAKNFLSNGTTPDAKVLSAMLGWNVSAADRDLAMQAE